MRWLPPATPARDALRRMARAARHLPDRLLHRVRRRRAQRQIRAEPSPSSVVITCLGNVCRSPYAEARLAELLAAAGIEIPVSSAGLLGPGRPADETGRACAAARGLRLDTHVSRLLTPPPPGALILLMDPAHRDRVRARAPAGRLLVLGDLDPEPIDTRRIPDPFGHDVEAFTAVYDRIDRCLLHLARLLREKPGPGRRRARR